MLTLILIFGLGLAIAYANGSNDVSKGIATLVGSGVTNYRRAMAWGTLWTGIGAVIGAFAARAMIQTFGKGLLAPGIHATMAAALATIAGAAALVGIATRTSLPVSTTHAIVGSVGGVASLAYGVSGVNWSAFGGKITLPLLASPVVALFLTAGVLRLWKAVARDQNADCICVEVLPSLNAFPPGAAAMTATVAAPQLAIASCDSAERSSAGITLNHLHWLTSGAASFSRGLNDTPKMVAIIMAAAALSGLSSTPPFAFFVTVALGIVAGSWIAGRRVTNLLACRVTPMNHREGFVANLITSALVGPGAALGLPMSITHVASGAIMGVATEKDTGANRKTIRDMLLAWFVTLPGAALLGVAAYEALRALGMR